MNEEFDVYHKWLGIPPQDRPAHHYRLLGLGMFETDLQVIESAADRQMSHVRTFQTGRYATASQKLLNELAAARICLLNPAKKSAYDALLRQKLHPATTAEAPAARPAPSLSVNAAVIELPVAAVVPLGEPAMPTPRPIVVATQTELPRSRPTRRGVRWQHAAILGAGVTLALLAAAVIYVVNNRSNTAPVATGPVSQASAATTPQTRPQTFVAPTRVAFPAATQAHVERPVAEQVDSPPSPKALSEAPAPVVTLAVEPTEGTIDLLKLVDLNRDRLRGEWQRSPEGMLSCADGLIKLPYLGGQGAYQLEIDGQRLGGQGPLNVGIFHQGRHFLLCIDWNGRTFLSFVDGRHDIPEVSWRQQVFAADAPTTLVFQALDDKLVVLANGKLLLQWNEFERLSPNPSWVGPEPRALTLGWNISAYRISRIQVKPLSASDR